MQPKMGGILHLKLNNGERPIANKYREGKMKRTLKRELKVREIVKREAIETSIVGADGTRRTEGCGGWSVKAPIAASGREACVRSVPTSQHQFCLLDSL